MGRGRRMISAVLSLLLAVSSVFAGTVLAAEKPADMEEEQWERLQDNVLEYDELENRVSYFNSTIVQIVDKINESYDTLSENVADYQEAANDFEHLYNRAIDNMDYSSAVMYQINRTVVRTISKNYKKNIKKKDQTIDRSTRQAKKGILSGCQSLMLAYNQMAVNKATLEKQIELYGKMEEMYETQERIGMAIQTQRLLAQANKYSAQASLTSLIDQMESVKRSLLLLAGWDFDSDVSIGSIPKADIQSIDEIDFAADKAAAPSNNYTIISMRNAAPSSTSTNGKYKNKDYHARERGVEQASQQLSITLDSLYQILFEKRADLLAAETAFEAAQIKWETAKRKYEMGMSGQAEYLGEELAYCAAEAAHQTADLAMTTAMLNYYWAVNGLGELAE